ncbi:MAG TPA: ATP synthase F1 subunit epsilon [Lachnospiraceae bacterium]|nr:ATP synthase F1 subunit epsilon [Lachnospiraceae bacterium]
MADQNQFKLKIITPERVFFEGDADMVEFNTTEGEVGIYKNHIPMTMIIDPGILTITNGEKVRNAALHAGFVEILQESITILAEVIEWPEEINMNRAEAAKERAEKRIHSKDPKTNMAMAETALHRALARIHIMK